METPRERQLASELQQAKARADDLERRLAMIGAIVSTPLDGGPVGAHQGEPGVVGELRVIRQGSQN